MSPTTMEVWTTEGKTLFRFGDIYNLMIEADGQSETYFSPNMFSSADAAFTEPQSLPQPEFSAEDQEVLDVIFSSDRLNLQQKA